METKKIYRTLSTKVEYEDAGTAMVLAGRMGMTISKFLKHLINQEAEREKTLKIEFKDGGTIDPELLNDVKNELGDALAEIQGLKIELKKQKLKVLGFEKEKNTENNRVLKIKSANTKTQKETINRLVKAHENEILYIKDRIQGITSSLGDVIQDSSDTIEIETRNSSEQGSEQGFVHLNLYKVLSMELKKTVEKLNSMF